MRKIDREIEGEKNESKFIENRWREKMRERKQERER
jgi:hypothetical protein